MLTKLLARGQDPNDLFRLFSQQLSHACEPSESQPEMPKENRDQRLWGWCLAQGLALATLCGSRVGTLGCRSFTASSKMGLKAT